MRTSVSKSTLTELAGLIAECVVFVEKRKTYAVLWVAAAAFSVDIIL